ncbi:MAG: adenylyl-sulfate kinase [Coriobacteriales bacterium]
MKGLLKILTCGSVDDGKSTLLGHLLYDAKLIFADQRDALLLESKAGSRGGKIDYSLLLDGLAAEREQGITIDVAYRYFTTDKRSFIAADCPGHEEYTRNMAVGAGFADLAVILIDATKGVLTQTRRHTRICALMGIRHFVYAVNKMDLVSFDQAAFSAIEQQVRELVAEFKPASLQVIPVSATEGDNVARGSQHMPWYAGPTLQEYLEEVDVEQAVGEQGFTMPVQRVCRPSSEFRGFQGSVSSGSIRVGDELTVLPSGSVSTVSRIVCGFDDVQQAAAGQAVTICLADEVDVSRGCVLASGCSPQVGKAFSADLLWMDDADLLPGKNFSFRLGTRAVSGTVLSIEYKIDANTGERIQAKRICKNEIAHCDIALAEPVVFDFFEDIPDLGCMILVDRLTNMTSGCAVVRRGTSKGQNLTWQETTVNRSLREGHMGQRAVTLWFTGLSGSGKSTLANAVEQALYARGRYTMMLDGDNVRMGLNKNLGFGEEDRIENIRRIAEVSKLMNDAGLVVLTSFISPFVADRRNAREVIGAESFVEIYVSTPLEECERRDVKGLYKRARAGQIPSFTGISSPYEPPVSPELTVDTSALSVEEGVQLVLDYLDSLE